MRKAIMRKTRLAKFAPWALAALVLTFVTSDALAGKPGGGTTPTYTYVNLGTLGLTGGWASAINQSGLVAGTLVYEDAVQNYRRAFVVVPKDTNSDGKPDVWLEDQNHDGLNDLQLELGWPLGFAPGDFDWVQATDINDHGQIAIVLWTTPESGPGNTIPFVLTPADVNGDGKLEFFQDDGTGANALMKSLAVETVLDYPWPAAINNLGQVVGHGNVGGVQMGYVVAGQDTDGDGIADTWFADANGDGQNDLVQVLGYAWDPVGKTQAAVVANDINDQGQIAGRMGSSPCLVGPRVTASGPTWWADANSDGLNDLALALPILSAGRPSGEARGIGASGKLVGTSYTGRKTDGALGILWQVTAGGSVQTTQLAPLSREQYHTARAMNAQDVIVGCTISYNKGSGYASTECAFVWQNGVTKDLRLLTDQAAALAGTWMGALGINDTGAIVGGTEFPGPASHPFIAVPKTLP